MDIEILESNVAGLVKKGQDLREKEANFLKVSGVDEQIAKVSLESEKLEDKLEIQKEKLQENILLKNKSVLKTLTELNKKMDEVLPEGNAFFDIDGKEVTIGWTIGDVTKPYDGLSGGEIATFNSALAHCLNCDVIIQESAELDDNRLVKSLSKLLKLDKQILVLTCHKPKKKQPKWETVEI